MPDTPFYSFHLYTDYLREVALGVVDSLLSTNMVMASDTPIDPSDKYEDTPIPATRVVVFGELYGGVYVHPDVAPVEENPATIQPHIQYSPRYHFHPFDIAVVSLSQTPPPFSTSPCDTPTTPASPASPSAAFTTTDVEGEATTPEVVQWLSPKEVDVTCRDASAKCPLVTWAQPLVTGPLSECMATKVEGVHTTLPGLLGLPQIKGNFWEGVVIRPYLARGGHRVVKFKVKKLPKVIKAKTPKGKTKAKATPPDTVLAPYLSLLATLQTEDRAQSIVSHYGVDVSVMSSVVKEYVSEVMGLIPIDTDSPDAAKIAKTLRGQAGAFIRQYFNQAGRRARGQI
ncbi:hypothetical protein KIPB_001210 [Kipferlia bialata]|uniref:Uncharacterized protein n=1 Tax=Kipferlia bialata TaxID=797122 RepID=A0A9K3GF15_9EUKA|nr:hypothetical protein KIPB_001210 [Kipferlia bialata]|eukprot:g1210.t1